MSEQNGNRPMIITYAGVSSSSSQADFGNDSFHDMQLRVNYFEVYSNASHAFVQQTAKSNYAQLVTAANFESSPIIQQYYNGNDNGSLRYGVSDSASGIYPLGSDQQSIGVSFYRQEYGSYYLAGTNTVANVAGPLEPVAFGGMGSHIRDFNIQSGHTYRYVAYPASVKNGEVYGVNADASAPSDVNAVSLTLPCWSLTGLTETASSVEGTPTIKKTYVADINNIWLFKFGLDTGSETQNLARSEIQTLGQFPRYSQGLLNAASGNISCYLGSEVIPFDPCEGYSERLWPAIGDPNATQSTNQGVAMLKAWKAFAYSKGPKLLKDMKGQSWIVQMESPTCTTNNYIVGHPTQISFSWKQIASVDGATIIASDLSTIDVAGKGGSRWLPHR